MALVADVRLAVQGRIQLFSLELKRAGGALGWVVAYGLVAAFMAHAAWFVLIIGLSWTAVEMGAPGWAVMLVVLAVHLAIAGFAVLRILKLVKVLSMPATMRHLLGKSSHAAVSPDPDAGRQVGP
jgi:hypothetical protein